MTARTPSCLELCAAARARTMETRSQQSQQRMRYGIPGHLRRLYRQPKGRDLPKVPRFCSKRIAASYAGLSFLVLRDRFWQLLDTRRHRLLRSTFLLRDEREDSSRTFKLMCHSKLRNLLH